MLEGAAFLSLITYMIEGQPLTLGLSVVCGEKSMSLLKAIRSKITIAQKRDGGP